ncbi:ABC transporter permease [Paenibacillus sp. BC26]|uniref:ABC transporter permease n=1 Tax=Paenibacillus sp. BC26 TaxID=1881032 RepID=UPI0008F3F135|nr:ABC transporter permease [Paenibacillus sp. BC26]SFS84310.1 ABC-2 type transport system permease protein [Paenibacillus sp. BC26]
MYRNGWKPFKKLFGAQFKMTFRDKNVWFWSIFYPVLLLVIFIMIFGGSSGGSFTAKLALVEPASNTLAEDLRSGLKQIDVFEYKSETPVSREKAEEWLKDRDVDAVIVLPQSADASSLELLLNKEKQNSPSSQAIQSILNNIVLQMNSAASGAAPAFTLKTEFVSAGSEELKYTDFLLTGLIALAISQAGLFGMVSMVEMRRNGLLKRLILTPASMGLFGLGGIAVKFILSAIQIVLLTLIGVLAFGAHINMNVPAFLIVFIVGTLSFAGIGFMLAGFSKTMESYFGMANLTSFIMMFISGVFFDINVLPSYIKPLANVMPLTYFANGIRDSMVYDLGMMNATFWMNIGVMLAWGLVSVIIGSKFYNWKQP